MLENIERDPAILIKRDNFTVQECVGRQPFTCASYQGELLCKKIPSPRPQGDSLLVFAGEAAVSIKFYFVEPFRSVGEILYSERIHWLDESDLGRGGA